MTKKMMTVILLDKYPVIHATFAAEIESKTKKWADSWIPKSSRLRVGRLRKKALKYAKKKAKLEELQRLKAEKAAEREAENCVCV